MAKRESDLLDQFIDALLRDPDAAPPHDLSPDLVMLAREIVASEKTPSARIQARVWQKTMMAVQTKRAKPNGHQSFFTTNEPMEEEKMLALPARSFPINRKEYQVIFAAAVVLMLLAGMVMMRYPGGNINLPLASSNTDIPQNQTERGGGTPINIGEPMKGVLTMDMISQSYVFKAAAGQKVVVQVNADQPVVVTHSISVQGEVAQGEGGGGGGAPALKDVTYPLSFERESEVAVHIARDPNVTGEIAYTIVILPRDGFDPSVQQQQQPVMEQGEVIQVGDTITATLDRENPSKVYTFVTDGGQIIWVEFNSDQPVQFDQSSSTIPGVGTNPGVPAQGGGGGGGGGGSPMDQFGFALVMTNPSQVNLRFTLPPNTESATITLTLSSIEPVQVTYGEPVQGSLSNTTYLQHFEFEGQRGEIVNIRVNGTPTDDLMMRVIDEGASPQGGMMMIAQDDDGGDGYLPEIVGLQLSRSGKFRIEVESYSRAIEEINFEVVVEPFAAPSLDEGAQQVNLTPKSSAQIATFNGVAGERVRLSVQHGDPNTVISVTVIQNGETIALLTFGNEPAASQEFTIPADGEVIVSVNGGGSRDPNYMSMGTQVNLTLEKVSE